jgi:cytochrome d ubiquinol oxidase subunit I
MTEIDSSLIDWSRAQFALTAIYHWLFVPLTLGLGVIMSVMETIYLRTGKEFWKETAKFWMKLFGINFAVGVATGLILEFEFGTNWSNYSWFVGDIFGAPLAIEGIVAFFMEATFIAIMFFGWNKVGKGAHLASTWLTTAGATLSALWILVANAWMQYPVPTGMTFNPDTVRNEMTDFWAVALSPMAINKFFHTVLSAWILGGVFVVGVSSWFLLKKRQVNFALASIKIGAIVGLAASLLVLWTGHGSAYNVARYQPMKLAAMEGLYKGSEGVGLIAVGVLKPGEKEYNDPNPFLFKWQFPKMLSYLTEWDANAFVPGIADLIDGGYPSEQGIALSAQEKIARGKAAVQALADYRNAVKAKDDAAAQVYNAKLKENFKYFGYGYIKNPTDLIPPVSLTFYAFHIMVILGGYFILMFIVALLFSRKGKFAAQRWLQWICLFSIALAYIAGQAGWVVAEVGRQPWAIQDLLPTNAAISKLSTSSVQVTFFLFLALFTVLLIAEIRILLKAIKKGPELAE